tara:strand:+ start:1666 stop:2418 length:753 start_codon:yes stop_codon:yes gene_type:complete
MKIFKQFEKFNISYIKMFSCKIFNKILLNNFGNQFYWNPPFDYVQNITIHNIFNYLNLPRERINEWCIVGVHLGKEIKSILNNYPNVSVVGFECSKRYIERLKKNFASNSRVKIINKAISSSNGIANFYETSLRGNGSLLEIGEFSKKSYGSSQKENFLVETTTLDTFYKNKDLDILWIDVQGAEKLVLEGAKETLKKIKAVFIEISIKNGLYLNSVTMEELDDIFLKNGFKLVLLGTDFNLTGNALYIK